MRGFKIGWLGAALLLFAAFGQRAVADDLKSVVRTLNAIINPEDAWRLEDQARHYQQQDEANYWHGYAAGLQQQWHRPEPVPQYRGWDSYGAPIDRDEAYRLQDQARRFDRPDARDYWRRYREGLGR